MGPPDTNAVVLQGWTFCGQILRICDLPHLQTIRPLITFGLALCCNFCHVGRFCTSPSIYTFSMVGLSVYFLTPFRNFLIDSSIYPTILSTEDLGPGCPPLHLLSLGNPSRSFRSPAPSQDHHMLDLYLLPRQDLIFTSRFFVDPDSAHTFILFLFTPYDRVSNRHSPSPLLRFFGYIILPYRDFGFFFRLFRLPSFMG